MCVYRRSEHIELLVFASPQKVHVMHAYLLVMRAYRHRESTSCYSYMPLRRRRRQEPMHMSQWGVRATRRFMSVSIEGWKFSIRVATTVILA